MHQSLYFKNKASTLIKSTNHPQITKSTTTIQQSTQKPPSARIPTPRTNHSQLLRENSSKQKIQTLNKPKSPEFTHKKVSEEQLLQTQRKLYNFQEIYTQRQKVKSVDKNVYQPRINDLNVNSKYLNEKVRIESPVEVRRVPDEKIVQRACQRQYEKAVIQQQMPQKQLEMTFQPQICEKSLDLVQENFENRLRASVQKFNQRKTVETELEKLVNEEKPETTSYDPTVFQRLYVQGMERFQLIQQKYEDNIIEKERQFVPPKFQPEINENAKQLSINRTYRLFNEKGSGIEEIEQEKQPETLLKSTDYDLKMQKFYDKNIEFLNQKQRIYDQKTSQLVLLSNSKLISEGSEKIASEKLERELKKCFSELQNSGIISIKQLRNVDKLKCGKMMKKCISEAIIENVSLGEVEFVGEVRSKLDGRQRCGEMVYSDNFGCRGIFVCGSIY